MERVCFDYSRLKGRIVEKVGSQKKLAELLNISESTMTAKLAGTTYFTQGEIFRSLGFLDIDPAYTTDYFFTVRV